MKIIENNSTDQLTNSPNAGPTSKEPNHHQGIQNAILEILTQQKEFTLRLNKVKEMNVISQEKLKAQGNSLNEYIQKKNSSASTQAKKQHEGQPTNTHI